MSASEFTSQLKTAFRFSKVRMPRTFIDKRLNSLLCPILPEWVGPNLVAKFYQHIYSNLTLKEILDWHAAIPLNNRKWKENNHENENKNNRVQSLKPRANGRNIVGHQLPTLLDVTCCVRLHTLLHVVGCCCVLLRKVWNRSNFSATTPNIFLFRDRRSVAQQSWIRLHSSSNIVGARKAFIDTVSFQSFLQEDYL